MFLRQSQEYPRPRSASAAGSLPHPQVKVDGFANAPRKSLWQKFCPLEVLEEVVEHEVSLERCHHTSSSFVRLLLSCSER